jgi:cytidine diphosphoramidate kinase
VKKAGLVVWITGLSGAGKSTVAGLVAKALDSKSRSVALLDGDAVRAAFGNDLGHSRPDRLENAYRIARLCRLLSKQGVTVVCSTMSLFKEIHKWNRKNLPNYLEVYLRVPFDELRRRDPKGIYKKEKSGVVGVHLEYDEPRTPHLVIDNHGRLSASAAARKIAATARARSSAGRGRSSPASSGSRA